MTEPRIIKKYPNRRLYDTEISSYITLEEIRQLVLDDEEFEVRDAKTGENLTRSVLLQIISEYEDRGQPMFTTKLLSQIIVQCAPPSPSPGTVRGCMSIVRTASMLPST